MNREYHKQHSAALNRDMEMLIFGHAGARVIVFPTSCGRFFDWENRGMIDALSHHIEQGWIQVFCVDSVDPESWWNFDAHPKDKALRHLAYHKYIIEEALPFTKTKNDNDYVIALGASMGGYHAMSVAVRFPEKFNRTISMSGPFDFGQMSAPYNVFSWVWDYYDDNINECNPVQLVKTESNGQVDKLKKMDIIFAIGQTDPLLGSNQMMDDVLNEKGVPHAFRVWDGFAHDWPVWHEMVLHYIGGDGSK
ncbi:MAG: esterase family protein [Cyanobacteria bacterium SZAS-4]|nr:esterase family protein [Cyanobacteria bacterium SZAS-4]